MDGWITGRSGGWDLIPELAWIVMVVLPTMNDGERMDNSMHALHCIGGWLS